MLRVGHSADHHGGQPEFVEEGGARVGGAGVDDEHAVHPVFGPPAPVDGALRLDVLHHLEQQAEVAFRQDLLDARDELEEERVHAQRVRGAGHDESDRGRAFAGQGTGRRTGPPAELFGNPPHPVTGDLGDPWPVVERERHGALRHTRPERDVLHGRSARGRPLGWHSCPFPRGAPVGSADQRSACYLRTNALEFKALKRISLASQKVYSTALTRDYLM